MEGREGPDSPSITSSGDKGDPDGPVMVVPKVVKVPKVELPDLDSSAVVVEKTAKTETGITGPEAAVPTTVKGGQSNSGGASKDQNGIPAAVQTASKSGHTNPQSRKLSFGSAETDKRAQSLYLEGIEARFVQRCEVDLCLDEKTCDQALMLFKDSKPLLLANISAIGTGTVEETERLWNACILFVVKRFSNRAVAEDDKMEDIVGFTLSQILKATKISVQEFFKELPQFVAKAGPKLKVAYGDDWEKRLMVKEVQTDFYYLTVLFNYYKRVYQNLFLSMEGARTNSTITSGVPGPSVHMRFGWMLFLVLRMRVLGRFVDLVTYINGLLAVLIILILHMPPSLRKFSFEDDSVFKKRTADGRVQIIASLCARYHDASEEDVSKMVENASNMIGDIFRKSSGFIRTRSQAEQLAGIDTEGLAYFEGLMDERSLTSNLRSVEKDYEEAYHSFGELDERMFINGDESLIGPVSSSGTPTSSGTKRKLDSSSPTNQVRKLDSSSPKNQVATVSTAACPSSPTSPQSISFNTAIAVGKMPPPTPVSETMSTVKWLRTYISPLPSQPSAELQHFFHSCDYDITAGVNYRAQVLFEEIFSAGANYRAQLTLDDVYSIDGSSKSRDSRGSALLDGTWVKQRRLEATKLYYRVLAAMCKAESQRLVNKNLTALLTNERFHRCMIACSAELVLYTHKTITMTFPAVLEPTGITAFDLSKVIENFIRHEETLPRELKRHLNSMEQQILESMAWEKGSSMYNTLIVAKKTLTPYINRLGLLADPMPTLDHLSQHVLVMSNKWHNESEEASVDGAAVPTSPQKVGSSVPIQVNGASTTANGTGEQTGNLLSPIKERPSAFSAFTSPAKNRTQQPLQSAFASPQRPSPHGGGETCAETVINVFFQKVLKLAAVRIRDLCERLRLSNQVLEQVYRTMQHILYKVTHLCFNRHIDQLILCSMYGVCKVNKANVTFKTCIEQYGKQPQCKRQVFCNVFIDLPQAKSEGTAEFPLTGDIIKFYNEIFVPATKQFLVQLSENTAPPAVNRCGDEEKNDKDGSGPASPRPSFPALPDMSPKKVSASHNVYVSPLRSTKMDTIMSPHTRSLYACVGESTHAYQSPSKDLTAINNRLNNRRLGRLDFNGASLVSDSLVAGSLYPCTRSTNHHSIRLVSDSVLSGQTQPSWAMAAPLPPSPLKRTRAER